MNLFPTITPDLARRYIAQARSYKNDISSQIQEEIFTMDLCLYCKRFAAAECGTTFRLLEPAEKTPAAKLAKPKPARTPTMPRALQARTVVFIEEAPTPDEIFRPRPQPVGCVAFQKAA